MAQSDASHAHPVPHLMYPKRAAVMIVAIIVTLFVGMMAMQIESNVRINSMTVNGEGF